jgi:hypothetical protein
VAAGQRRRWTFAGSSLQDDFANQLIDDGGALIGVDEEPFPIERHDVHPQRVGLSGDRRPRIELMGPDPNDPAQQDHGQRRDRPDDELDTPFIGFVREPARRQRRYGGLAVLVIERNRPPFSPWGSHPAQLADPISPSLGPSGMSRELRCPV